MDFTEQCAAAAFALEEYHSLGLHQRRERRVATREDYEHHMRIFADKDRELHQSHVGFHGHFRFRNPKLGIIPNSEIEEALYESNEEACEALEVSIVK